MKFLQFTINYFQFTLKNDKCEMTNATTEGVA